MAKGGTTTGTGGSSGGQAGSTGATSSSGATGVGGVAGSGGAQGSGGASGSGGSIAKGGSGGGTVAGKGGSDTSTGGAPGGVGGAGGSGTGDAGKGGVGGAAGSLGGAGDRAGAGGMAGAPASSCPPATKPTGGTKICSNQKGNGSGNYVYELWSSGTGTGCMTVYSKDATFSANWSSVDDFLARIGLGFDNTKTPDQIGTLSAEFAETKTGEMDLTYIGIYGWTLDPRREYYIIDDWAMTKPGDTSSDGTPRDHVGTITVDGDDYEVWKHTRTNKPAIDGDNKTFDQYFSVRHTARQCGHISISEHFSKWIGLGLSLGNLVEAKILLEAQGNSGTVDFTTASVTVSK
jgi:hypothetical protein